LSIAYASSPHDQFGAERERVALLRARRVERARERLRAVVRRLVDGDAKRRVRRAPAAIHARRDAGRRDAQHDVALEAQAVDGECDDKRLARAGRADQSAGERSATLAHGADDGVVQCALLVVERVGERRQARQRAHRVAVAVQRDDLGVALVEFAPQQSVVLVLEHAEQTTSVACRGAVDCGLARARERQRKRRRGVVKAAVVEARVQIVEQRVVRGGGSLRDVRGANGVGVGGVGAGAGERNQQLRLALGGEAPTKVGRHGVAKLREQRHARGAVVVDRAVRHERHEQAAQRDGRVLQVHGVGHCQRQLAVVRQQAERARRLAVRRVQRVADSTQLVIAARGAFEQQQAHVLLLAVRRQQARERGGVHAGAARRIAAAGVLGRLELVLEHRHARRVAPAGLVAQDVLLGPLERQQVLQRVVARKVSLQQRVLRRCGAPSMRARAKQSRLLGVLVARVHRQRDHGEGAVDDAEPEQTIRRLERADRAHLQELLNEVALLLRIAAQRVGVAARDRLDQRFVGALERVVEQIRDAAGPAEAHLDVVVRAEKPQQRRAVRHDASILLSQPLVADLAARVLERDRRQRLRVAARAAIAAGPADTVAIALVHLVFQHDRAQRIADGRHARRHAPVDEGASAQKAR
jgi:hypothetical protein